MFVLLATIRFRFLCLPARHLSRFSQANVFRVSERHSVAYQQESVEFKTRVKSEIPLAQVVLSP